MLLCGRSATRSLHARRWRVAHATPADKYRVRVLVTRDTRELSLKRCYERCFSPFLVFILQSARILIDLAIRNANIFDERARADIAIGRAILTDKRRGRGHSLILRHIKSPLLQRLTYLSVSFVHRRRRCRRCRRRQHGRARDRRNKRQGALSILFTSSLDERGGRRPLLLLLLLLLLDTRCLVS